MVRLTKPRATTSTTLRDTVRLIVGIVLGWTLSYMTSSSNESASSLWTLVGSTTALTSAVDGHSMNDGFHPVHVYYGKQDLLVNDVISSYQKYPWWLPSAGLREGSRWFSQHGQDVAVASVLGFPKNGFFVDLAANDAVWASNTFQLERSLGWKGICIEANPIYWFRLAFRTNCHVVGAIVGHQDGDVLEVALPSDPKISGPFGGIVGQEFDNKRPKRGDETSKRYSVSLRTILKTFQAPRIIDYMSLDVEGAEWFIMQRFPFDEYQIRCLTIERPNKDLQSLLQKNGYTQVYQLKRGDTLWVQQSMTEVANRVLNDSKTRERIENHAVNPQEIPTLRQ